LPKSKDAKPSYLKEPLKARPTNLDTSDKIFQSEESVEFNKQSQSIKKNNNRLNILRMWLIFLIFCFIFEECALEIPGMATMDEKT